MIKQAMQFLHEVRVELSKVVWPKRDEFVGSTLIVLFLVAIFGVYFFVVDNIFSKITSYVLGLL